MAYGDVSRNISDGAGAALAAGGGGGGGTVVIASQAEAEGNVENTKTMSSLRTYQNWINNIKTYANSGFTTTSKTTEGAINELRANKADLVGGLVPANQLPSYVDDVVEVANFAALPVTGESGKIYITINTNSTYRWTGSAYVAISNPLDYASQAEAEADIENTKVMTSLRVSQSWVSNVASYTLSALNTASKFIVGAINELLVDINARRLKTEIGDAHGFVNPPNASNFTLSNVGSSVTVGLLANAGNYKLNGTDYVNSGLSLTFTASLGQNFVCVNASGLVVTPINITDLTKIPCITVNWDGTNARLADELHLSTRNLIQHKKEHDTDGARWVGGFVSTFGAAAANTFSSATGIIRDEERYHTIAAKTRSQVAYRNAAQTAMIFEPASTTYAKLSAGVPQYDNAGVLTALGNNNYGVVWMYATNAKLPVDSEIVFVLGQASYNNVAATQAAAQPTIVGMTAVEWKLLYRVIFRQVTNALVFTQADDLRTTTTGLAVSGGGFSTLPASQVTVTPSTGYTSTDIQGLSDEFGGRIDLTEYLTFEDNTVVPIISRPYNFTISAKTEVGGTAAITTSADATYTLGTTVLANGYLKITASAINTRVYLTLTRV